MTATTAPGTMDPMAPLTVGQVAQAYGVTVRTLHHYDAIGLLRPSARTAAGYRLYTTADLQRLAHVVVYRRLGLSLEEVAELLADVEARGEAGAVAHLRRQRAAVMSRLDEMNDLVRAIDRALESTMTDAPASTEDLREMFGQAWDEHEGYQEEAQQRWGATPQWAQGEERHARMSPADWAEVKAETEALERDLGSAHRAGEPADGEVAVALAERHRRSIERHYDCPPAFHVRLGEMYVADPRFTAHYDEISPGLTRWLRDAIVANAARRG